MATLLSLYRWWPQLIEVKISYFRHIGGFTADTTMIYVNTVHISILYTTLCETYHHISSPHHK